MTTSDTDLALINKAYCDVDGLITRGQTLKTRLLARQLKRLLNKAFKKATRQRYTGQYNEEIWHLTSELLRDIPLGVDANEILLKADIQQTVNGFVHQITIADNEMIHLKN